MIMARIAVNADQVEAVVREARKITDQAEAAGESDPVADAMYEFGRWVLGDASLDDLMMHLADE
jgi:hypothetical protein